MNREYLNDRNSYLNRLILNKEKSLKQAPDGKLRVIRRGPHTYFYQRQNKTDTNGSYIRQENMALATALAQKKYDQQILLLAQNEQRALNNYLKNTELTVEQYYETLDQVLQDMVTPIIIPDKQYAEKWQSMPYTPKPFDIDAPKHYTQRKERVRSKSEVIIANTLDRYGIPYRYECPLHLKNNMIFHPDFTVLNVRKRIVYFWEHMGKMDDPEYVKNALERIDIYEDNGYLPGIQLILTHETYDSPLQLPTIEKMIKTYLL